MVMRLAVSNIAWRPENAETALDLLHALGVPGLEIAPGLAFASEPDPMQPSPAVVEGWRSALRRRALTLVSMQSLLFGQADAALFGDEAGRRAFESGVSKAIDLAGRLGCPNLVLGSPTARRIPDGMDEKRAQAIAAEVIGRLGDRCRSVGAILSLEPNPAAYGTNFLNTFAETVAFVRELDHPAVRVNLDLGALTMNGDTEATLAGLPETFDLVGHVHISEPHLAPVPSDAAALTRVLAALVRAGHQGWVSIEMRAADGDAMGQLRTSVIKAQAALHQSGGDRA